MFTKPVIASWIIQRSFFNCWGYVVSNKN